MSALGDVATAKYVLLTTYRKDGTPVATPVWGIARDDNLHGAIRACAGQADDGRNNRDERPGATNHYGSAGVMRGRRCAVEIPHRRRKLLDRRSNGRFVDQVIGRWIFHCRETEIAVYIPNTATARMGEPVPPRHFRGRPM